ncbi:maleylpyruvate isomerase family mycothiol-dependent enzyme [Streptomyces boetiae]|uniref:maleylpyruvate isomerase family mycothiol-dependent enzyme n=1 Tax=Streptomyces boetiae TaxID=3075541 RepID=UPI00374E1849
MNAVADFLPLLEREGEAMARAAVAAGPDAEVPTCPGWRVRDLVLHLGNVHRWATRYLVERRTAFVRVGAERVPDEALAGWLRAGLAVLLDELAAAPKDLECWTFLKGSPSARHFWARRQTHETAVHRMDAELAAGLRPGPVEPWRAADGVAELLTGFHGRARSRVRSERQLTLRVRAVDVPAADWLVRITEAPPRAEAAGDGPADCEISGPAAGLYAALWNRLGYGEAGVEVRGDAAVAGLWRSLSGI